METLVSPMSPGRIAARGAVPALVFAASLAVAFVVEPLSLLALLLGVIAFAVLTASTVARSRHPGTAVVAASAATALVSAGIILGSWAALPLFWIAFAVSGGTHVSLRLLEKRDKVTRVAGAVTGLCAGAFIGVLTPARHTTLVGLLCIAAIGGLAAFRLVRGAPPDAR